MTVAVMMALLWGATVYRIVLSVRHPFTVWRTALTVSVSMTAVSMSLWGSRQVIDQAAGVPNLANLLYHNTTLAGLVSALIYVESLRHSVLPRWRAVLDIIIGAATALTMTLAWVAAPIHDRFYPDLAPMARLTPVALYTGVFYLFMVWALARQAVFCFTQGLSREDPARTVSLVLNGCACGLGALISAIWAAAVAMRFSANSNPRTLSRVGDVLLPAPLIMLSLGILTMFVMPWLLDVVRSYLRLRALRPAWRVLTELHPEVRLHTGRAWGLRSWLQTRERRTAIEIEDALRLRRLQHVPDDGEDAVDRHASTMHTDQGAERR